MLPICKYTGRILLSFAFFKKIFLYGSSEGVEDRAEQKRTYEECNEGNSLIFVGFAPNKVYHKAPFERSAESNLESANFRDYSGTNKSSKAFFLRPF